MTLVVQPKAAEQLRDLTSDPKPGATGATGALASGPSPGSSNHGHSVPVQVCECACGCTLLLLETLHRGSILPVTQSSRSTDMRNAAQKSVTSLSRSCSPASRQRAREGGIVRERGRGQARDKRSVPGPCHRSIIASGRAREAQQDRRHPQCAHLALSSATSAGNVQRLCAGRLRVLRMREQSELCWRSGLKFRFFLFRWTNLDRRTRRVETGPASSRLGGKRVWGPRWVGSRSGAEQRWSPHQRSRASLLGRTVRCAVLEPVHTRYPCKSMRGMQPLPLQLHRMQRC